MHKICFIKLNFDDKINIEFSVVLACCCYNRVPEIIKRGKVAFDSVLEVLVQVWPLGFGACSRQYIMVGSIWWNKTVCLVVSRK